MKKNNMHARYVQLKALDTWIELESLRSYNVADECGSASIGIALASAAAPIVAITAAIACLPGDSSVADMLECECTRSRPRISS